MIFISYYRDTESDNDYALARSYVNRLARFLSADPAGLAADSSNPQSWNRYSYVLDDPLNFIDPLGLFCMWDDHRRDDKPEEGGATKEECKKQGGTWIDPTGPDGGSGDPGSPFLDFWDGACPPGSHLERILLVQAAASRAIRWAMALVFILETLLRQCELKDC